MKPIKCDGDMRAAMRATGRGSQRKVCATSQTGRYSNQKRMGRKLTVSNWASWGQTITKLH